MQPIQGGESILEDEQLCINFGKRGNKIENMIYIEDNKNIGITFDNLKITKLILYIDLTQ